MAVRGQPGRSGGAGRQLVIPGITRMGDDIKRKDRPGDQPLPVPNRGPSMHDLVLADLEKYGKNAAALELAVSVRERRQLGLDRYGIILQAHNGRDALQDASEEAVDLLVYLRQAMAEARARDKTLRCHLDGIYHDALSAAMVLAWVCAVRRTS